MAKDLEDMRDTLNILMEYDFLLFCSQLDYRSNTEIK